MCRCAFIVVMAVLLTVSPETFAQDATGGGEAPAFNALDTFWITFAALAFLAIGVAWGLRVSRRAELWSLEAHDHGMDSYVSVQNFVTDLFECVELGTGARGINVL